MTTKNKFQLVFVLLFFILACNFPMVGGQAVEATLPAPLVQNVASPLPENTLAPTASPVPTVQHLTQPGEPTRMRTWVSDRSSATYASERRAVGDGFNLNLYERPFTTVQMEYQPYLDLTKVEVGEGGEWIYVTLHLEGAPPQGVQAFYAIEIDTDRDGRGDWLIGAFAPPSTTWTADGAKIWADSNNDVGGNAPMLSEAPLSGLNGYDQLLFDSGQGNDPDAAWARIDPTSAQRVQLAFKHNAIQSAGTFLWGGWTDEGVKEAGWFDYNDHFTLAEAGSPLSNNANYPLAALFSVDNTCRWTYGFEPTEEYPGLCPLPEPTAVPPTPTTEICFPPATYVCENWNYETCECEDTCSPPPQGCGDNSEWLPYPQCYCAPY